MAERSSANWLYKIGPAGYSFETQEEIRDEDQSHAA